MAKKVKQAKPTQRQIRELVDLFKWKLSSKGGCKCQDCLVRLGMYQVAICVLKWAVGDFSEDFGKVIEAARNLRAQKSKGQTSHAE